MNTRVYGVLAVWGAAAIFAGCEDRDAEVEAAKAVVEQREAVVLAEAKVREEAVREREAALVVREQQVAEREQFVAKRELEVSNVAERIRAMREVEAPVPAGIEVEAAPTMPPQPAEVAVPPPTAALGDTDPSTFYEPLQEHGSWFETETLGYVWRPSVVMVNAGWRPYAYGRWVFTECGWTWCSDEAFGWACYHYGRWSQVPRVGWVWVPGRRWGPGWVAWRVGDGYVGWAPLGPGVDFIDNTIGAVASRDSDYCFVPARDFCDERVDRFIATGGAAKDCFRRTRDVTRIEIDHAKKVVVKGGPNLVEIETVARVKPAKLRLDREPAKGRGHEVTGETLRVAVPPAAVARNSKPRRVDGRIGMVAEQPVGATEAGPGATGSESRGTTNMSPPPHRQPSAVAPPTTQPTRLNPMLEPPRAIGASGPERKKVGGGGEQGVNPQVQPEERRAPGAGASGVVRSKEPARPTGVKGSGEARVKGAGQGGTTVSRPYTPAPTSVGASQRSAPVSGRAGAGWGRPAPTGSGMSTGMGTGKGATGVSTTGVGEESKRGKP